MIISDCSPPLVEEHPALLVMHTIERHRKNCRRDVKKLKPLGWRGYEGRMPIQFSEENANMLLDFVAYFFYH